MTEFLEIDGMSVPYRIIRRKGQKHINIRISHTGDLRVSAPYAATNAKIRNALDTKRSWLSHRLARAQDNARMMEPLRMIMIDGTWYATSILPPFSSKNSKSNDRLVIDKRNQTISFVASAENHSAAVSGKTLCELGEALRLTAKEMLVGEVREHARERDINISRVYIRNQRTRWGSSSGRGNISLNWRAIMIPPVVRTYLIMHELAHQYEMNHSPAFWNRVADWCPDYRAHDMWLKDHSFLLGVFR